MRPLLIINNIILPGLRYRYELTIRRQRTQMTNNQIIMIIISSTTYSLVVLLVIINKVIVLRSISTNIVFPKMARTLHCDSKTK